MCLKDNSSLELSKPQLFHFGVDAGLAGGKSRRVNKLPLILLVFLVSAGSLVAEDKAYKSIFDGKTLTGWEGKKTIFSARCARREGEGRRKKEEKKDFDSRIVGAKATLGCFQLK